MVERARELAARAYFGLCLASGRMVRSATYSKVWVGHEDGRRVVRKHRRFYAPLLIWMGNLLVRILDAGVRVLRQRDWEERERRIYASLRGSSIAVHADGVLDLPFLAGDTLAALLEDPELDDSSRKRAIEHATVALAEFHRLGFTHADAMAENVLVDLDGGVARWFDFETIHDANRPLTWRRADDVRALIATCLLRTVPGKRAETLDLIVDVYGNEDVTRALATIFGSVWRRSLTLHLAQAGLSFQCFREISRQLRARSPESGPGLPERLDRVPHRDGRVGR